MDGRTVSGSPTSEAPTTGNVVIVNQPPVRLWSPGFAALLSFFVPGLGQLYKGQFFNGVMWFFMVMFGYAALVIPGLILHFFCVLGALRAGSGNDGCGRVSPPARRLGPGFELVQADDFTFVNPAGDPRPYVYALFQRTCEMVTLLFNAQLGQLAIADGLVASMIAASRWASR